MTLEQWMIGQDAKVLAQQKNSGNSYVRNLTVAYYGAIGGGYTSIFEVGTNKVMVQNGITGDIFFYEGSEPFEPPNWYREKCAHFMESNTGPFRYRETHTSLGIIAIIACDADCLDLTDYEDF